VLTVRALLPLERLVEDRLAEIRPAVDVDAVDGAEGNVGAASGALERGVFKHGHDNVLLTKMNDEQRLTRSFYWPFILLKYSAVTATR
jgi:hypothetical protein